MITRIEGQPILRIGQSVEGEQISGRKVKRVIVGAAAGAVIGAGGNYFEQRGEIKKTVPLEDETPGGLVRREVIIFQRVDKREVARAAVKGAVHGAAVEIFNRESNIQSPLPLAA